MLDDFFDQIREEHGQWVTTAEAAELLEIGSSTFHRNLEKGFYDDFIVQPSPKIIKISREGLIEFIKKGGIRNGN